MSSRNDQPLNQNIIVWCQVNLSSVQTIHKKSLYSVYDLLGDVGGLFNLFTIFVAFIMTKYNYSLFLFNATNHLRTFTTTEVDTSNDPPASFNSFLFESFCSCLSNRGSSGKINQQSGETIGRDAVNQISNYTDRATEPRELRSPADAISYCEDKITEHLDVFNMLNKLIQLELMIKDDSIFTFELRDRLNGLGRVRNEQYSGREGSRRLGEQKRGVISPNDHKQEIINFDTTTLSIVTLKEKTETLRDSSMTK